ncbi:RluA family pseudouridine synthase [Halobacteriovorax sp. HLS]|uniref:RluA family pseudouridine synthase n=1 Tax=Halobacteriovorax sp. HLS TaxID=2234000 RepID=UPI0013E31772|nr:RNA pseudouridine synthase [Halobacteriovorax sp. HLS]
MKLKKTIFRGEVKTNEGVLLVDFLSENTGLSKAQIKKIATNGGVWLKKKGKGPLSRIRRAKATLNRADYLELHYDPNLAEVDTSACKEIYKTKTWGVWYKPSGILSQGTKFGDQASILRVAEKEKPNVYLIQRLDRETAGLMIIAYTDKVARIFTKALQSKLIRKFYQAEVLGKLSESAGELNYRLEDKEAKTLFKLAKTKEETSLVEIEIITGRYHQIRQHFDKFEHPVMGDPKYGRGNKNKDGMKLVAHKLELKDPISKEDHIFELPKELRLF